MKSGTSLIECILYMACCTFCTFIIISWWNTTCNHINHIQNDLYAHIQLHMIEQIMFRDLLQASPREIDWSITPNQMAVATSQGNLFYKCKKGILTRALKKPLAHRRSKAVIGKGIKEIEWLWIFEKMQIKGVAITITAGAGAKRSFTCPVKRGAV